MMGNSHSKYGVVLAASAAVVVIVGTGCGSGTTSGTSADAGATNSTECFKDGAICTTSNECCGYTTGLGGCVKNKCGALADTDAPCTTADDCARSGGIITCEASTAGTSATTCHTACDMRGDMSCSDVLGGEAYVCDGKFSHPAGKCADCMPAMSQASGTPGALVEFVRCSPSTTTLYAVPGYPCFADKAGACAVDRTAIIGCTGGTWQTVQMCASGTTCKATSTSLACN